MKLSKLRQVLDCGGPPPLFSRTSSCEERRRAAALHDADAL
jgi:hypothetical protein